MLFHLFHLFHPQKINMSLYVILQVHIMVV